MESIAHAETTACAFVVPSIVDLASLTLLSQSTSAHCSSAALNQAFLAPQLKCVIDATTCRMVFIQPVPTYSSPHKCGRATQPMCGDSGLSHGIPAVLDMR